MAWQFLSGWMTRARQYFQRVTVGVRTASYIFQEAAKGKPLSEVLRGAAERAGIRLTPTELREAVTTGEVVTPKGPVIITPEIVKKSVAGAIPRDWIDLIKIRAVKLIDKKNIFGRFLHWKVRLQVWEEYRTAEGEKKIRVKDVWATVASDKALTTEEIVSRAAELATREPDWQVPASGERGIVGIPEIHPYAYLLETGPPETLQPPELIL